MIRPGSLHRGDDDPEIVAQASNINQDSLDCGITAMRCCNTHACQKLGTTRNFVIILGLLGLVQGAIERYFRLSVRQAASQFDYEPVIVEWLLVTAGLAQGALAIVITYWANRIHRISWLGSLLMLQAFAGLAVIIPIVTNNNDQNQTITAPVVSALCTERTIESLENEPTYADTTLAMMFVLQVAIGAGNVVLYTLGLSYLDDNVRAVHSPALIGTVLACWLWGSQFGAALGHLVVSATTLGWWLGWSVLTPLMFTLALLVSLFPRRLIKSMVRQAADTIVHEAFSSQQSLAGVGQRETAGSQPQQGVRTLPQPLLSDISFNRSLRRMFTNRVLMCNALAATFVATAAINYAAHETSYLRARFLLPTLDDDLLAWPSRLWTQMVRPVSVALAVLLAGLVIAKARPSPRRLAAWSALTGCLALALFVAYVFIDCDRSPVAGGYGGRLTTPFCSRSCLCDPDIVFTPVCPAGSSQTYFSPCNAGCADVAEVNDVRLFTNCTCGTNVDEVVIDSDGVATEGACGADDCQPLWILYQMLTVLGATAVASAWVGRVLLAVRCVLRQDRALALAVELTLVGLVAYGPGHAGYQAIANNTCAYWSHQPVATEAASVCQLHTANGFPTALNIVSAVLMLIAVFFDVLVWSFAKDVELYEEELGGDDGAAAAAEAMVGSRRTDVPMQTLRVTAANAGDESAQPFLAPAINGQTSANDTNVVRFRNFNGTETPSPQQQQDPANLSVSERMRLSQMRHQQQQPQQSNSPSPTSTATTSITYARVHRNTASHAAELNFRMQQQQQQRSPTMATGANGDAGGGGGDSNVLPSELMRWRALAGGDINPSRGNRIEAEPEVDIAQMERSLSSIGGSPVLSGGGGGDAGGVHRSRSRTETDF